MWVEAIPFKDDLALIVADAVAAFVGLFVFVALGPTIRLWRYVERA